MSIFDRTIMVIGSDNIDKLRRASVAVFGIGGVGSFVSEGLVRAGVGKLCFVDADKVEHTNINRQIIALHSTIGQYKAELMAKRALDINPDADIQFKNIFFSAENAKEFDFASYDYVVDAIDTVSAKIALIECCKMAGTPIISSMGTGNKTDPKMFEIADIYSTSVCPLARVMRKELKLRGIENLKVLYSKEQPHRACRNCGDSQTPGSVSFVPSVAGLIIAGEVVCSITGA